MIKLNMDKKSGINRLTIGAFDVENNILTLKIDVGEYPLEGKVITAIFEGKPETAPLNVEEGIIKLPITADLIEPGTNKIQLNFRWDLNKLEQSSILWWNVNKSLLPEGIQEERIDIVGHLISEVNRVISETGDIKEALDESVVNANTINNTLSNDVTGTIKVATDIGIDLEDTIEDANFTKGLLETTIDDSETAKTDLEGTIVVAGNAQSNLNNKIGEATTSKEVLEQAIVDNQIVKKTEFMSFKEDYANQFYQATNLIKNGDFSNGLNNWNLGAGGEVQDGRIKFFSTSSAYRTQFVNIPKGHKVYVRYARQLDRYLTGGIGVSLRNGPTPIHFITDYEIGLKTISEIVTPSEIINYVWVGNMNSANADSYFDDIMVINLTQCFGVGNEPTKEEMDLLIDMKGGWFNETVSLSKEVSDFIKYSSSDSMLKTSIKGTTQKVVFNSDGTVQKVEHKNSLNEVIRTDTFAYATNIITEVRTLVSGKTLTLISHLDTLETEVI